MLGFTQSLTPISSPQPLMLSPYLNPTLDDSDMFENQQPAQLPWPLGVIQHTTAAVPRQTPAAPPPQACPCFSLQFAVVHAADLHSRMKD